jgi:hypothetical protein
MISAHEEYWQDHVYGWGVYQYDPADDGPEVELILFFKWRPRGIRGGIEDKKGLAAKLSSWWFQPRW